MPVHVAFIMDGNGRWAQKQGLPRIAGHEYGVQCIQPVLETLGPLGVKFVTLYAFSTENWGRPQDEVDGIMDVFSEAIANELDGTGVKVMAFCPGPTKTDFQKRASQLDSKIIKGRNLPSAEEVARFGYDAMLRGRTFAIHGAKNRFFSFLVRLLPRNMVTKVLRSMQKRAR